MLVRTLLLISIWIFSRQGFAQDNIPGQFGELVLGKAPPSNYLVGEVDQSLGQAYYVKEHAFAKMWLALAPGMPNVVMTTTIATYKGDVGQIIFTLEQKVKFETIHRYFAKRFGDGLKTNVRVRPTEAMEDCPRLYLIQQWSSGGITLTVLWSKSNGVSVVVQNDVARKMEQEIEQEDGVCVKF